MIDYMITAIGFAIEITANDSQFIQFNCALYVYLKQNGLNNSI